MPDDEAAGGVYDEGVGAEVLNSVARPQAIPSTGIPRCTFGFPLRHWTLRLVVLVVAKQSKRWNIRFF